MSAGQHHRLLPGGNRGQGKVIVSIRNGCRSLAGAGFKRSCAPLLGERDGRVAARPAADLAQILPQSLVLIVLVHGPGKGVAGGGIDRQGAAIDGTGDGAGLAQVVGAHGRGESGAGLIGQACPRHAVGRLVIAVIAHRGDEQLPHRIPHHRRGGVARRGDGAERALHDVAAVGNGGQVPRGATIRGVIQALVSRGGPIRIHQRAFIGLRNRGHGDLGIDGAPGEAGKTLPDESEIEGAQAVLQVLGLLDQAPGVSVVGGAQDTGAVIGIEYIVGVARAGQDHAGLARLHGEGADADGGVACSAESRHCIGERSKDDGRRRRNAGVVGHPDAASGGAQVKAISVRCAGGIEGKGGHAASDQPKIRG